MLACLDDPVLIFGFLWHYHLQKASIQSSHSRVHSSRSDTQQRMCVTGAKPERSRHWHPSLENPLSSLENPRHSLQVPAGSQRWKVKLCPFHQASAERWWKLWWSKVLELCVWVLRGKCPQQGCCTCLASESGLVTVGRKQRWRGMRQKTSGNIMVRGNEYGGRRSVISSCSAAASG